MLTIYLLSATLFLLRAHAIPEQLISKRQTQPCAPGGRPVLYKDYYPDSCTPKNALNADGSCPMPKTVLVVPTCASLCEIRTTFTYKEEVPIGSQGYCHGPLTCTVTDTETKTITWSVNIPLSAKIWKEVSVGITGGWSTASATTLTETKSVNLAANQCGYMTFLPEVRSTCSSVSTGHPEKGLCVTDNTTPNVCASQLNRTPDGKSVVGSTIFVKTDCGTNERLPMDQQDPAYNHPGVAMPQSELFSTLGITQGTGSAQCNCNENGCTPDSPPCCANGTCGPSTAAKTKVQTSVNNSTSTSKGQRRL